MQNRKAARLLGRTRESGNLKRHRLLICALIMVLVLMTGFQIPQTTREKEQTYHKFREQLAGKKTVTTELGEPLKLPHTTRIVVYLGRIVGTEPAMIPLMKLVAPVNKVSKFRIGIEHVGTYATYLPIPNSFGIVDLGPGIGEPVWLYVYDFSDKEIRYAAVRYGD
jgi:hypothetical protein